MAERIYRAVKPGGLLVVEGFANPPNGTGFEADGLRTWFGRMRILRDERVEDYPDWYVPEKVPLARFVAEKIQVAASGSPPRLTQVEDPLSDDQRSDARSMTNRYFTSLLSIRS